MAILAVVCLIIAIILFVLAAWGPPPPPRISIGWLGLAFFAAYFLFKAWPF